MNDEIMNEKTAPDKNVFHSMDGFEEHYFQNDVKKYPVVYRRRVTAEESQAIDDWLEHRRVLDYMREED